MKNENIRISTMNKTKISSFSFSFVTLRVDFSNWSKDKQELSCRCLND